MKKLVSMLLAACTLLSCGAFASAAGEAEEGNPPFKMLHGEYYYNPEVEQVEEQKVDVTALEETEEPFKVLQGELYYDPVAAAAAEENPITLSDIAKEQVKELGKDVGIVPFATTKPTKLAPASFYNVNHYWTATNYTWSSYIFTQQLGFRFDCRAQQYYEVELYYGNGRYIGTTKPDKSDYVKAYWLLLDWEYETNPYYFKIVNKSGTPIRNNALYRVSDIDHGIKD